MTDSAWTGGGTGSPGAFSLDTTALRPRGFDGFRHEWETQVGDAFPLPAFGPDTTVDIRVKGRATQVRDAAICDVNAASVLRSTDPGDFEDGMRMCVVRRGSWTLDGPGGTHTISAGRFQLRHVGAASDFATTPNTSAKIVALPAASLKPLLGNRIVTGSANSAEMRMFVAHTNMLHNTMADLGAAGVQAAHSALLELAKGVARHRFDDKEPLLASALAQAAKDLADGRLADPALSSATLARDLNVSVRTLQRAFSAGGESVSAYIRLRRLEEARLALTAGSGRRLSVSEAAAHWQFADSSHFIRSFKRLYGRTPTDYVRGPGGRQD